MVHFRGLFKFSDENPCPFHTGVRPGSGSGMFSTKGYGVFKRRFALKLGKNFDCFDLIKGWFVHPDQQLMLCAFFSFFNLFLLKAIVLNKVYLIRVFFVYSLVCGTQREWKDFAQ